MSFRKVLVAVDSSPLAVHAADVGAELARALGAELAFIHVVDLAVGFLPDTGVPAGELVALAEKSGKELLEQFRRRLPEATVPLEFMTTGKPAKEIVKAAREWPAEVIVIGSHGRGGVKRVLLGSVAEGVMRHAECPVLVIRAPE